MYWLRLVLLLVVIGVTSGLVTGCGGNQASKQPAAQSTTDPAELSKTLPPPSNP
ncbi:MAG: hypothetical protein NZ899_10135 [Thermoguttaceae bacterium]|nr:hypothetical protein [Thermoguttaceae bacterium]MDW8078044.1 hypothetical protein [Thermoguttaceae bacterium]